jgi:hypothetical protein
MKGDIKMAILKINMERVHKSVHHALGVAMGIEKPYPETEESKKLKEKFRGACNGAFDFVEDK